MSVTTNETVNEDDIRRSHQSITLVNFSYIEYLLGVNINNNILKIIEFNLIKFREECLFVFLLHRKLQLQGMLCS